MTEGYLLWKCLHLISLIAWMAGQLYLPRLFVYHAGLDAQSDSAKLLQIMEMRLQRYIMTPAMVCTFLFGILLIASTGYGAPGTGYWIHAKILLVLGLAGSHGMMAGFRRKLAHGTNTKSPRFFKIFNEIQTILMIGIVVLVVFKPF